ncbi:hypothetical protein SCHPADRAFT_559576 [Schizopora paradoxa]|uniref:DUF7770 domain-containing protein n=1 Tax=Schizopora paradoxa TaxID=27342 RepID=A0A0H2RXT7_9AGAM|nr:hypothetical protein SCHPADRAFT_559576 [Schizopora paradoxa]
MKVPIFQLNAYTGQQAVIKPALGIPQVAYQYARNTAPAPQVRNSSSIWQHTYISRFYMSACPTGFGGVHWRLYLQYSDHPAKSIRVDCKPSGDDLRTGKVVFDLVDYAFSSKTAAGMMFKLLRPISVLSFWRMLCHYNIQTYRYAPGVYGCRYWCQIVLKCLEVLGFLAPGEMALFLGYIADRNRKEPNVYPLPIIRGEFLAGL